MSGHRAPPLSVAVSVNILCLLEGWRTGSEEEACLRHEEADSHWRHQLACLRVEPQTMEQPQCELKAGHCVGSLVNAWWVRSVIRRRSRRRTMSSARMRTFNTASFSESFPESSFGHVRWIATAMLSLAAPPSEAVRMESPCVPRPQNSHLPPRQNFQGRAVGAWLSCVGSAHDESKRGWVSKASGGCVASPAARAGEEHDEERARNRDKDVLRDGEDQRGSKAGRLVYPPTWARNAKASPPSGFVKAAQPGWNKAGRDTDTRLRLPTGAPDTTRATLSTSP